MTLNKVVSILMSHLRQIKTLVPRGGEVWGGQEHISTRTGLEIAGQWGSQEEEPPLKSKYIVYGILSKTATQS